MNRDYLFCPDVELIVNNKSSKFIQTKETRIDTNKENININKIKSNKMANISKSTH